MLNEARALGSSGSGTVAMSPNFGSKLWQSLGPSEQDGEGSLANWFRDLQGVEIFWKFVY